MSERFGVGKRLTTEFLRREASLLKQFTDIDEWEAGPGTDPEAMVGYAQPLVLPEAFEMENDILESENEAKLEDDQ